MQAFYLVWEPQNGYTKHRHEEQGQAEAEAERLADIYPGKEFFVLQALTMSRKEKPIRTIILSDLPF